MSSISTTDPVAAPSRRRPTVSVRRDGPRKRRTAKGRLAGYGFIAPFFLLFFSFSLFPFIYTAWVSLHRVELSSIQKMEWIGFDNYVALFANPRFWLAFRNTVQIGVLGAIPQLVIGLALAHLLNYKMRGRTFFRVAMLTPYACSIAAATLIFAQIFAREDGIINLIIKALGGTAINWESGTMTSKFAIAAIVVWRWTGYTALIYLASMQAIPNDLYEAASIDGSSRWQDFLHVTLPSLRPTIWFMIITSTIGSLQMFGEPLLFSNNRSTSGGTQNQYQTLGLYMYDQGWTKFHLGTAASIAWAMFIIIILAVGGAALIMRLRTWYDARPRGLAR